MTFLSEDSTILTVGFLVLTVAFVTALRTTQQGKYLVLACVSCGLAIAIVAIEYVWVTDNELIEQVVYQLGDAVQHSNPERVLSHLAPNVQYSREDSALSPDATRELIRKNIGPFRFNLLRVGQLKTNVSAQARRGTADFQVLTRGNWRDFPGSVESGTALTTWSLGFQETEPGVWKVSRISPVSVPVDALALMGTAPRSQRYPLGLRNDGSDSPIARRPTENRRHGGGYRSKEFRGAGHPGPTPAVH
jgi:hypothetical protein